jgi:hypothetical protein
MDGDGQNMGLGLVEWEGILWIDGGRDGRSAGRIGERWRNFVKGRAWKLMRI